MCTCANQLQPHDPTAVCPADDLAWVEREDPDDPGDEEKE